MRILEDAGRDHRVIVMEDCLAEPSQAGTGKMLTQETSECIVTGEIQSTSRPDIWENGYSWEAREMAAAREEEKWLQPGKAAHGPLGPLALGPIGPWAYGSMGTWALVPKIPWGHGPLRP